MRDGRATFAIFPPTILSVCAAVALLAACSGNRGSNLTPTPSMQQSMLIPPSMMDPDATGLLYVSDPANNDIAVYSYPEGKPNATLKGVSQPAGECVSKSGNVFIANQNKSNILVYAHGGSKPLRTIDDPNLVPLGCSVDPTTGNLAVSSYTGSNNHGGLAIYTHAMGKPKTYDDSNIPQMYFCGYDNTGNLFVDGITSSRTVVLGKLPKGGSKIQTITLNQTIGLAGGVQWDGTYVAVGDVTGAAIYRFKTSGGKGTKVGTTALKGSTYVDQFWIQGSQVVAPDYVSGKVRFYKYPGGGSAVKTITGLGAPIAATVSN